MATSLLHGALVGGVLGAAAGSGYAMWTQKKKNAEDMSGDEEGESGEEYSGADDDDVCPSSLISQDSDMLARWFELRDHVGADPDAVNAITKNLERILTVQNMCEKNKKEVSVEERATFPRKCHLYVEHILSVVRKTNDGVVPGALSDIEEYFQDTVNNVVMSVQQSLR